MPVCGKIEASILDSVEIDIGRAICRCQRGEEGGICAALKGEEGASNKIASLA
jgi:hypothetical protein